MVLTAGSSSSVSSSASWDVLSDIDSLFSLPRLTILNRDGRLQLSSSASMLRFPPGRLSLRSSLRRPGKLRAAKSKKKVNDRWHRFGDEAADFNINKDVGQNGVKSNITHVLKFCYNDSELP